MAESKRLTAAELFQKYDADGGGSIDAEELQLMLDECGHHPDVNTGKELMAEFGDGMDEELSFEAFSAMLRKLDARKQFAEFDADGSGSIDADELLAAMRACGHEAATAEDAGDLVKKFGDGVALDQDQFQLVLAELDALEYSSTLCPPRA